MPIHYRNTGVKIMKHSFILLAALLSAAFVLPGQAFGQADADSVPDATWKRLSFAKAYFGLDLSLTPAYGSSEYLDASGNRQSFDRSAFLTPGINIGGMHFWGYADFFVSINTVNIKPKQDKVENSQFLSVLTGARVYPWPLLENGGVRPFFGYKFTPVYYEQSTADGS
jgi:hypothetical protein